MVLSVLKMGLKTHKIKIYALIAVLLMAAGAYGWGSYISAKHQLKLATTKNEQLVEDNKQLSYDVSAKQLEIEMMIRDSTRITTLVKENEKAKQRLAEETEKLRSILKDEKAKNKALDDCWDVDLGAYADGLQSKTESR